MNELQTLLAKKREIENQIKALKANYYKATDLVKIEKKNGSEDGRDWVVSVLMTQRHVRYESWTDAQKAGRSYGERVVVEERDVDRWQSFVREKTKKDAIDKVTTIIGNLTELLIELNDEEESENV